MPVGGGHRVPRPAGCPRLVLGDTLQVAVSDEAKNDDPNDYRRDDFVLLALPCLGLGGFRQAGLFSTLGPLTELSRQGSDTLFLHRAGEPLAPAFQADGLNDGAGASSHA